MTCAKTDFYDSLPPKTGDFLFNERFMALLDTRKDAMKKNSPCVSVVAKEGLSTDR